MKRPRDHRESGISSLASFAPGKKKKNKKADIKEKSSMDTAYPEMMVHKADIFCWRWRKEHCSCFHGNLMHRSGRNRSGKGRMACTMSVIDGKARTDDDEYMEPEDGDHIEL